MNRDEKGRFVISHKTNVGRKCKLETREKISLKQRGIKEKYPIWNKGLTKETSESVKKYGEKNKIIKKGFFATEKGKKWIEEHKNELKTGYYKIHKDEILKQAEIFKKEGFQVLICDQKRPDLIVRKNNNIFAIEIETLKENKIPNYEKWNEKTIFDDIHWIIIKKNKIID